MPACLTCTPACLRDALPCAEAVLTPAFVELCYNLESFHPAFTSCLLQVGRRTHAWGRVWGLGCRLHVGLLIWAWAGLGRG